MGNNSTQNSKLDETVKESLNNYEAKYDAGDWSRMERMLDATPKTSVSSISFGKIAIIAAAVILGGFLVYKAVNSSSPDTADEKKITSSPAAEPKPEPKSSTVTATPPAVTTNTVTSTPPAAVNTITPAVISNPTPQATVADKNKSTVEVKKPVRDNEAEYNKNQKITIMGNEPIFGDMIDSSKGVIHETKEKEATRKAAKNKGSGQIGLNGLLNMHLNLDSLNKYNESQKRDSIH